VLRAECLLDYFDYLPRVLGLAIACRDWKDAELMCAEVDTAIAGIRRLCEVKGNGITMNGYSVDPKAESTWDTITATIIESMRAAVLGAWPWQETEVRARPEQPTEEAAKVMARLGMEVAELEKVVCSLVESDLARTPLKEHRRAYGYSEACGAQASGMEEITSHRDEDVRVILGFLRDTKGRRIRHALQTESPMTDPSSESVLPYLFPTRPYTPREIAELDARCVDPGEDPGGTIAATEHWGRLVRALRGIWTRVDVAAISACSRDSRSPGRVVSVGVPGGALSRRLCLANLSISDPDWHACANGTPSLSLTRYGQLARLVNSVLRAKPRPHYLLLPELALPRRWVPSVANRLLQSRISLVSGVEYEHLPGNQVRNDAVLALIDDRLGFESSVFIWQHKTEPAPAEEEVLLHVHGRSWAPVSRRDEVVIYRHQGVDFGVLICSELQKIRFREAFQGEVDCLLILGWNKDLETFSALVEAAALDVHAYVAFVNNRRFGDSRVRCPAKEQHNRDLCRIRGGLDDFAVTIEVDVAGLRRFQSRAKSWPRADDPFKPVPQGFRIAARRRDTPGT
jgi:hypothetical protein